MKKYKKSNRRENESFVKSMKKSGNFAVKYLDRGIFTGYNEQACKRTQIFLRAKI